MKLQTLVLTALLLNAVSLMYAVKLTLVNKSGEPKLAISPCPSGNCDNYKNAAQHNLPSIIVQFSDTYVIDTTSSTFKNYPQVAVHTIGGDELVDHLDISSYKQPATFTIEKGKNWLGMTTFKIKKQ